MLLAPPGSAESTQVDFASSCRDFSRRGLKAGAPRLNARRFARLKVATFQRANAKTDLTFVAGRFFG